MLVRILEENKVDYLNTFFRQKNSPLRGEKEERREKERNRENCENKLKKDI